MKAFNLRSTTAVVVANMIGTGVFTSLGYQLMGLQSVYSIIALWLVGGVSSLMGALVYAELARQIPRSGGEYHFLGTIYHPVLGFSAGFVSLFFGFAAPLALMSMALGKYMEHVLPLPSTAIALIALLSVAAVHLFSVHATTRFQVWATGLKVFLILFFIAVGFWSIDSSVAIKALAVGDFTSELWSMPFAVGLAYVFFSYSGWNAATYFSDEIQDARTTIFKALVLGVVVVSTLYILLHFVFMLAVPAADLVGKIEVGHVVAKQIFGPEGGHIMSLLIGVALLSSISSLIVAGPRVAKVMGEDYHLFRLLTKKNSRDVPVYAILAQVLISIFFLLTGSFESVLVYTGFVLNIFNLLTVFSLFVGQRKKLFRVSKWLQMCATLFIVIYGWATAYLFYARTTESLLGTATVLFGVVCYFATKNMQPKEGN